MKNSPKVTLNHTQSDPHTEKCPQGDPQRAQSDPQGSQSQPKDSQSSPKWPPWRPKCPQGLPKSPKGGLKWSPEASPDPLKSIKKEVQDHPGTPLRKWTSPCCENPIIYYVFEGSLCENPIIYYVLSTSRILSFLESDENTAPATLLEPPKEPVLAREREARLFFKKCSTMFSTALLCFAVLCSTLLHSSLCYPTVPYPTLL